MHDCTLKSVIYFALLLLFSDYLLRQIHGMLSLLEKNLCEFQKKILNIIYVKKFYQIYEKLKTTINPLSSDLRYPV